MSEIIRLAVKRKNNFSATVPILMSSWIDKILFYSQYRSCALDVSGAVQGWGFFPVKQIGTDKFNFIDKKWEDILTAEGESITFSVQTPAVLNLYFEFQKT